MKKTAIHWIPIILIVSLSTAAYASSEGNNNTYLGQTAGQNLPQNSNYYSTFIGYDAGLSYDANSEGKNTFIGYGAGKSTKADPGTPSTSFVASENTFVGVESGLNNVRGYLNTYMGYRAAYNASYARKNVCVGNEACAEGNDMLNNTAVGYRSGYLNKSFNNVFIGKGAGYNNEQGDTNVFIGSNSGSSNNKSGNTFLGSKSGFNADINGSVLIGNNAGYNAVKDNTLYISNSDTDSPLIYGEFDNNLTRINGTLEVNATKKDVSDANDGSEWAYFALTMQANDIPDHMKWIMALHDPGDDANRSLLFYNPNNENAPLQLFNTAQDNLLRLRQQSVIVHGEDINIDTVSSPANLIVGGNIRAVWRGSNTVDDGLSVLTLLSADNQAPGKSSDVGFGLKNIQKNFQWNFRTFGYQEGFTATKLGSGGGEFIVQSPTNDYHDARMIVGGVTIFENGHLVDSSGNPIAALIQQQSIRLAKTEKALQKKESMIIAMQTEIASIKTVSKEKDQKIALLEKKQQQQALKIAELETIRQKVAMLENLLTNLALNTSKTEKSKVSLLAK